jgi:hypothetical protein
VRLDHRFTEKWTFNGKFQAERVLQNGANQVDLRTRNGTNTFPSRPRNSYGALTTVISPSLTNEARFSWLHDRLGFNVILPQPQVGLNAAINFGTATVDDIVDVDTQRARNQFRTLNIYQWSGTLTWVKGSHNVQMGGNLRRIRSTDYRDDKVIGSITTPVAEVSTVGGFVIIPPAQRPGFIQAADAQRYNDLYAGLLGMVSTVPALITRDANLRLRRQPRIPVCLPAATERSARGFAERQIAQDRIPAPEPEQPGRNPCAAHLQTGANDDQRRSRVLNARITKQKPRYTSCAAFVFLIRRRV